MGHLNKSKLKLVDKTCFVSDDAIMAKQSNKLNNCKMEDKTLQYSFEKSCFSHKLFVTLSSVAVSRQKGRSRVNESFM